MRIYRLERDQLVRRPLPEVFAFFADPANLARLTPRSLRFRMLTPGPISMRAGALIDHSIRVHGVPLRWRTLIETYEPERRFVDVQLRGPYKSWRHTHEFEATADGTWVRDRVEYTLPFGLLGRIAQALLVQRDLTRIFDYRRDVLAEVFPAQPDFHAYSRDRLH